MSSLHFQEEFTKINIWLQLLKNTRKRLPDTQAHKQEISYAQAQKQETSKQKKMTQKNIWGWYTISGVHNTNQIRLLRF